MGLGSHCVASVNSGFSPLTLSPYFWYDLSDAATVTTSGGLITQVNDKSGNARHLIGSGGSRPTYTAAGLNGLNVATFGSGHQLSVTPGTITTQPYMTFAVAQFDNSVTTQCNLFGIGTYVYTLTGTWRFYAGSEINSAVTDDALPHVFCTKAAGASSYLRLDGNQIAAGNAGITNFGQIILGSAASSWRGIICEVLCCPDPGTGPRDTYIAALKAKWATT